MSISHEVTPQVEQESLKDEVHNLLEESRMVLPGIQALFGFQLIAGFNQGFGQLPVTEQYLHYSSLVLVALAIAFRAANENIAEKLHLDLLVTHASAALAAPRA